MVAAAERSTVLAICFGTASLILEFNIILNAYIKIITHTQFNNIYINAVWLKKK